MRNYGNWPAPERLLQIEAQAEKAAQEHPEEYADLLNEEVEQPPDRGAPPPGDDGFRSDAELAVGRLQFHPAAGRFRLMTAIELRALADDIEINGQDEDVETLDGMVLGGRNVYDACLLIGREPRIRALSDNTNPLDYLISKNLMRRHSTKLERAIFSARLVTTDEKRGGDRKSDTFQSFRDSRIDFVTPGMAAERIGLSPDAVHTALYILKHGADEFIAAIDAGIPWLTLNFADKVAHSSKEDQVLWLFKNKHAIKPVKRARRPPRRVTGITTATLNALSRGEIGALVLRSIPKLSPEDALQAVKDALLLANQAAEREGIRIEIVSLRD